MPSQQLTLDTLICKLF